MGTALHEHKVFLLHSTLGRHEQMQCGMFDSIHAHINHSRDETASDVLLQGHISCNFTTTMAHVDAPEPRQTFQKAPSHEYYSGADEEYDVVFCAPVLREWLLQAKRITARIPCLPLLYTLVVSQRKSFFFLYLQSHDNICPSHVCADALITNTSLLDRCQPQCTNMYAAKAQAFCQLRYQNVERQKQVKTPNGVGRNKGTLATFAH